MRKMTDESLDGTKGDYGYGKGSYTQWVELRYAEVLLGLAEAANEIGETEEGVEQLKLIRKRAGILPVMTNVMEYQKTYLKMILGHWFKMKDI